MGEAKLPLFAYVDETGNTGHNLFDEAQPDFYTVALITKGNFDLAFGRQTIAISKKLGVQALHATELGVGRIEAVSYDLTRLLDSSRAHFFVSRVEKRYLLTTKMFDTLFDSGENAAVAWHSYNIRPLRLLLSFKLASLVDDKIARRFWSCVLETNKDATLRMLPEVCADLLRNLDRLPDSRSREILSSGLEWAHAHPETIHLHTDRKIARQGHFPNMVAFANLLDGLDGHSELLKRPVARITHDQQSEFHQTLKLWHNVFSNASPDEVRWIGETYKIQKVAGSQFEVKADSSSSGIQIADIVLWLYHRYQRDKPLPAGCQAILSRVFDRGWESDFSFRGVQRQYIEKFGQILNAPLTDDQEARARKMLADAEVARLRSMKQYEQDGLPPFMRGAPVTVKRA